MTDFPSTTSDSKARWEKNADHWDARMGDTSNTFHRMIVRPHTEELLDIKKGDVVLDISCGTGNFSERLAEKGADVVAFDFSEKMIEHARKRRQTFSDNIEFHVCDATQYDDIIALKKGRLFDKAVANMAVMDIAVIEPLFRAVTTVLKPGGIFVFSFHHPCFVKPEGYYLTACIHEGEGIIGQPVKQLYYHHSLQDLMHLFFQTGFVIDGFFEEPDDDKEVPVIIIIRLRKS